MNRALQQIFDLVANFEEERVFTCNLAGLGILKNADVRKKVDKDGDLLEAGGIEVHYVEQQEKNLQLMTKAELRKKIDNDEIDVSKPPRIKTVQ